MSVSSCLCHGCTWWLFCGCDKHHAQHNIQKSVKIPGRQSGALQQAARTAAGTELDGSYLKPQAPSMENKLEMAWGFKVSEPTSRDTLPPRGLHLWNLPKYYHYLGTKSQRCELLGDIFLLKYHKLFLALLFKKLKNDISQLSYLYSNLSVSRGLRHGHMTISLLIWKEGTFLVVLTSFEKS